MTNTEYTNQEGWPNFEKDIHRPSTYGRPFTVRNVLQATVQGVVAIQPLSEQLVVREVAGFIRSVGPLLFMLSFLDNHRGLSFPL